MVHANWIGKPFDSGDPRSLSIRHVFPVETVEAWVLSPAWTDVPTSHLVTRYRIWVGAAEEYRAWVTESLNADANQDVGAWRSAPAAPPAPR
jgi:hypothetical protein